MTKQNSSSISEQGSRNESQVHSATFQIAILFNVCFSLGQPCFAQSNALAEDNTPLIGEANSSVNLDGVIRNAKLIIGLESCLMDIGPSSKSFVP